MEQIDFFISNSYYADIRKTAKNWFRTDYSKRTVPVLNVLINICDILHCDIDYFLTNQTEYNSDIALVSGITGLTFQSVENLIGRNHNINMQSLSTLNYLLGEDPQRGFNFLFLLYQYLFGNYQKIRGLQGDHIEFVDDTDFNGTAIEITNLIQRRTLLPSKIIKFLSGSFISLLSCTIL